MESKPIQPLTNQIKYHFASKAEGQNYYPKTQNIITK